MRTEGFKGALMLTLVIVSLVTAATSLLSVSLVYGNTLPTAPVVDVTPDSPVTTDDLVCTVTTPSTDPDNDTITYTYMWYRNQGTGFVLQSSLTTTTTALSVTIDCPNTTKGDVWRCVVRPNDGTGNGPTDQDEVTIGNSAPSITAVTITPDPAYTNNTLDATPSGWYDPDGDPEGYQYQWQIENVSAGAWEDIPGETSTTLSSSYFVKNDQIRVICWPHDGTTTGSSKSDQITISNSLPSASNLAISPSSPITTDDLTATYTYSDVDGDAESGSEIRWYKDNVLQSAYNDLITVPSAATAEGEAWYFTVKPKDGTDFGALQISPSETIRPIIRAVEVTISPAEKSGSPEETLAYTVTVANVGNVSDNYDLTVGDNSGWQVWLDDNLISIPIGENRNTALRVKIPDNATPCMKDNVIVTATSRADNTVTNNDSCIAHRVKADFSLVTLYEVILDMNIYLNEGSKLVVKFYTYGDAFENENVIENFSPPWQVEENEGARHPEGIGVKKVRLDLTTDDTENVISTIASFTVRKVDLETRFMEIPFYWAQADAAGKLKIETEFMEIPFYWSGAPD